MNNSPPYRLSILSILIPYSDRRLSVSVLEEDGLLLDEGREGGSKVRPPGGQVSGALDDQLVGHAARGRHYHLRKIEREGRGHKD